MANLRLQKKICFIYAMVQLEVVAFSALHVGRRASLIDAWLFAFIFAVQLKSFFIPVFPNFDNLLIFVAEIEVPPGEKIKRARQNFRAKHRLLPLLPFRPQTELE